MSGGEGTKRQLAGKLESLCQRIFRFRKSEAARNRADEALRESEERYRTVFENTGTAIAIIEEDMTISMVNTQFVRLWGYSKEEIEGKKKWTEFVVKEDLERLKKFHSERREERSKAPRDYEFRFVDRQGLIKDIFLKIDVIPRNKKSVASLMDISARKCAERQLRDSEERYRTILETIEDGYYEVDISGNLTFFNTSLCKILGYPKDELSGLNPRHYSDQENTKKLFQAFNKVYTTREPTKGFDWEIIRKDGAKRHIDASVSLIVDAGSQPMGFRGIVRDITDRKIHEALLKAHRDAEAANRQLVEVNKRLEQAIARSNEMALQAEKANVARASFWPT